MNNPKISIVTVVFNAEKTIAQAIESVVNQTYGNIEYIVVDGKSTDNTLAIIQSYSTQISHCVSEPDKGLYDAMNKGVALASGDVVGILNADDFLADNTVIEKIANLFAQNPGIDAVSTDVAIYKGEDFSKPWRYYAAKSFRKWQFLMGIQPPHPGFYVKREFYEKYGNYRTDFRIAADFDLMLRFIYIHACKVLYSPILSVKMRDGGISSKDFKSKLRMNQEVQKSLSDNKLPAYRIFIWLKYCIKIWQLVFVPKS